ncbi:class I SAM-dependent methyltransferase [Desulfovibrio piger]|uniref:class I SAM-dependent methyltransferase n=1 Tax=Desulfovibrio piger TaxID=901 RepID=UPI0026F0C527|nr:methyltransferase domain-containing protein [Desulfovibrio piger]
MKNLYGNNFYKNIHNSTIYSAQKILSIIFEKFPEIRSAADFGCGVGTWLSVLKEKCIEVHGFDGSWVPLNYLQIPDECFTTIDLNKDLMNKNSKLWSLPRYDLVISLEVAEHLPSSSADEFIRFLTSHSNFVLFSAAIPGQGGTGHINEQYPSYWCNLFAKYGFISIDNIRDKIWEDEKIPFWYRQNCFFSLRKDLISNLSQQEYYYPLDRVHPQQFILEQERNQLTLKKAIKFIIGRYSKVFLNR